MGERGTETVGGTPVAWAANGEELQAGATVQDRYRVLRRLGGGGYGIVYAVRDEVMSRDVALKLLRRDRTDELSLKRLRREVAAAAAIESQRVLRVFDVGESEQGPFFTMELCPGEALRARMAAGPMAVEEVLRIGKGILEALVAIHAVGVVHRDVKPGNVMLDRDGEVKLTDFGLALRVDSGESRLTGSGALVGTVEYLAPEQAVGGTVDARADLYSLGIVMYEMLTGKLPFDASHSLGAVVAHLRGEMPSARTARREVPRWLARFVSRLIERDPDRRFSSAADALSALQRRRVGWRPRISSLAGALLIGAVAATAGGWWHYSTRFATIVRAAGELRGLSRAGDVLWAQRDWSDSDRYTTVRTPSGRMLAIIRKAISARPEDQKENHTLRLFDAQTGRLTREVALGSVAYPGFSRTFGIAQMRSVVLGEEQAGEDLVLTFVHDPYYPSYIQLLHPEEGQEREVFVGSGHHFLATTVDLDGDRRKELILSGMNNRMGWYCAVAAIAVPPSGGRPADSPDGGLDRSRPGDMLWYALLPRGQLRAGEPVRVDEAARELVVSYTDGREVRLTFDGFPAGTEGTTGSGRQGRRDEAYGLLRDASRKIDAGRPEAAMQLTEKALALARHAGDPLLAEWAGRRRLAVLVASGEFERAERESDALAAVSDVGADIYFDVARALELRGQISAANRVYRKGIGLGVEFGNGRHKTELLNGAVLTAGMLGRWPEALQAIEGFERLYPAQRHVTPGYRQYVEWRMRGRSSIRVDLSGSIDLFRYVRLELDRADGVASQDLLSRVDELLERSSGLHGPALSLRAVLLDDLGRREEGLRAAREAMEVSRRELANDTETHALYGLVVARVAQLARAAGDGRAAVEAEREAQRFQQGLE